MRLFSVPRRRSHLVDLMAVFDHAVDTYRLKWAANFDDVFATFLDSPNIGFLDDAVSRSLIEAQPMGGRRVRIVFDPTTYSIPDDAPFWLQLVQVTGGVEGLASPPTLLLTEASHHGVGSVVIAGTAPSEATVANSLQIDLPRLMSDIRITNNEATGGRALYVATEPGGAELMVPPAVDAGQVTLTLMGTESTLLVRGGGGTVAFSATMTLAFPK